MTRAALLAAAAVGLASAARDPFAGRVAGAPERCVTLTAPDAGPVVVDAHTILYRDGTRLYRTGPRAACPALRPYTTLVVDVFGGQLCRGDRFRVLEPGTTIPGAFCQFTDFIPYTPAK